MVEILRFSEPTSWRCVQSVDMIADLGTRPGATVKDILPGSKWIEGLPWMSKDVSTFPVKTCTEIKLPVSEITDMNKELIIHSNNEKSPGLDRPPKLSNYFAWDQKSCNVPVEVQARYEFSNYLYDPDKYGFKRAVRVIAIIKKFIKLCREKAEKTVGNPVDKKEFVLVTDKEFHEASNYYFWKATREVKEFCKEEVYEKITFEKDEILIHKGRIISQQNVTALLQLTKVMRNLSSSSFAVPLIEKSSPLAYSIINEVHWNDKIAKHAGVETVLRYSMRYGYIRRKGAGKAF